MSLHAPDHYLIFNSTLFHFKLKLLNCEQLSRGEAPPQTQNPIKLFQTEKQTEQQEPAAPEKT